MSLKHRALSLTVGLMALVVAGCATPSAAPRSGMAWFASPTPASTRCSSSRTPRSRATPASSLPRRRCSSPVTGIPIAVGAASPGASTPPTSPPSRTASPPCSATLSGRSWRAGGYQVVTEPGPDTLLVIPAIVDLYITAPDTNVAARSRTYTANSGRMTLVLELRDSVTGETLARVVDSQSGRNIGIMTITNRRRIPRMRSAPSAPGHGRCAAASTACTSPATDRRKRVGS